MINKIIRNFIAKQMAGRSDDGIMITLKDPQRVTLGENILADTLMRYGIDPAAIKSEAQLKNILKQIENARIREIQNTGIRNTESAKVFDLKGREIPKGSKIMGGEAVDDMPPPGSRGGKDDIAAPVQSSEETLKNMIQAENKKNIAKMRQRKMLDEAIDDASPGFSGDRNVDAELVAENLAERMGMIYDDMPTKERIKLYDEAYQGLTRKKFTPDDPEDFAKGGIARIGLASGTIPGGYTKDAYKYLREMEMDIKKSYKKYKAGGGTLDFDTYSEMSKETMFNADFPSFRADGGRIGLKDGMNRRTFLISISISLKYL